MEFQIQLHDSSKLSQNIWVFLKKIEIWVLKCFVLWALHWFGCWFCQVGWKGAAHDETVFRQPATLHPRSQRTPAQICTVSLSYTTTTYRHYYTEYWVSLYFLIFCLQEAGLVILFKVFPELLQSFWNSLVAFSLNPVFVPVQKQVKSLTTDI